jgi:hypothetical protein
MNLRTAVLKNFGVAVMGLGSGFLGGVAHDRVQSGKDVMRAQRFEVVSGAGKILSYWGTDSNPLIPVTTPKGVILVFLDHEGVRRCEIGSQPGGFAPELKFYDRLGPSEVKTTNPVPQPRFSVALFDNDDPELAMRGRDDWRVTLGAEHGDVFDPGEDTWSLRIRGGATSEAIVTGYKSFTGRYGAGVLVRDLEHSWTMPPSTPQPRR